MPPKKVPEFYHRENDWFCNAGLPVDAIVAVGGVRFHLHKFPLVSKCGKFGRMIERTKSHEQQVETLVLEEFPGGPDVFLLTAKFCYGVRLEMTARNVVPIICAADFLEMTENYGENNLLPKSKGFFHKTVLCNWKGCILALQSCSPRMPSCEKLEILSKCLDSLSTMACTDRSLLGWPMKMYGGLQSPGGSILWNGLPSGLRIQSADSDWWFEDVSYLDVDMFERLIRTMGAKGIRPEILVGCLMFYCRKYLPGLARWHGRQSTKSRTVACFSSMRASIDEKVLLERIVTVLPEWKGKSYCRFLFGALRVSMILDVSHQCIYSLEKKIGMQLELATLDSLLIPMYSGFDTLYDTAVIERVVHHFLASIRSEEAIVSVSPSESNLTGPLRTVSRLIDDYIAEVASDFNLKLEKFCSLARSLPDCSRSLHDGLYRAVDIYIKEHPCLSDEEKEQLCRVIDYRKLSIDACVHVSQNDRLPLRSIVQVLFFEQMHLRTAITGRQAPTDPESVSTRNTPARNDSSVVSREGWVTVMRKNRGLRVDMENMRTKVEELELQFEKIKLEMKKVTEFQHSLTSL